ncbi:amino acid ABC transporter ATP-binding/permease protein [Mobilicoccus massiliensis]|uniref:amino acid ABC transporter ATP-binding/permease protein n=1 Tax=Mobilicoccus massiliensis TaxID=1522310 RepID=UPI00058D0171|nr:ABC transporter ATP-binding protein [Mobilicoccus massiliensis]
MSLVAPPRSVGALVRPLVDLGVHLRADRALFVQVIVVEVASGLAVVTAAVLGARGATAVATGDPRAVAVIVALTVAVMLVGVFGWADMWLAHVLAYRVIDSVRAELHRALRRLVPFGLRRRRSGEVAAAAMSDAEALEWFYAHTVAQWVASSIVAVVVSAVAVGWLGPVGLLVPAGQLLLVAVPVLTAVPAARQGARLRHTVSELSAVAVEARHSAREIVLLGLLGRHHEQIRRGTSDVQSARRAIALRLAGEQAATEFVAALVTIGVLVGCTARVATGDLAPQDLPPATALAGAGLVCIVIATAGIQRLGEMSAAASRIVGIVTASPASRDDATAEGVGRDVVPHATGRDGGRDAALADLVGPGRLEVDRITVRYPDTERDVLHDLSAVVGAGEHVAVVGASGAGKTTLVHTLTRLIDPATGCVRLDGRDLATVSREATRSAVVLVEQRPYVFRTTVRENLDLAGVGHGDEAMWAALRDVGLAGHVRALPDGLDTVVAEAGRSWSGGQRQRLGLARGLLADPVVLVLDEPTADVDALTEADLLAALDRRRRGRTTVVVSHRPTTIAGCERALFLAGGRIAATGAHDDLMRTEPRYAAVLHDGASGTPTTDEQEGGEHDAHDPDGRGA